MANMKQVQKTPSAIAPMSAIGNIARFGPTLEEIGAYVIRYGLVLVFVWIGLMKFTAYEAEAIRPLVANSPFLSWMYGVFSVQLVSNLVGVIELITAGLIALRPLSARAAAVGGGLAMVVFITTLSFLFSTPGWEPTLGGFPALSVVPGQFLIKDVILLGAAIWIFGEALQSADKG